MKAWEQLLKEMVAAPAGRKVLRDRLGIDIRDVPNPSDEEKDLVKKEKPIVAILVPVADHPEPQMSDAVSKMVRATAEHAIIYSRPPISSSIVSWSRNWLIAGLIEANQPWTHALFIDDDIVPPPDALIKLLSHKKDIVAGLCTRRVDPPIPNIRDWDEKTQAFVERWTWPKDELIEVGAVGTGMILISRHALEQVAEAYFQCLYEREVFGLSDEKTEAFKAARLKFFDDHANAYWFRLLPILNGAFEMGEDVSFCFVAKRYCGIQTYVDTSVQPGHVGKYTYSIKDFLPHQEVAIRRAKAQELAHRRKENNEETRVGGKISVLIPSRENPEALSRSVDRLLLTAKKPEDVEIIIRLDDDDHSPFPAGVICRGPRHGYAGMHLYYNELAEEATGEWLVLWNDDAIMQEEGWDDKIREAGEGLKILNLTGTMNLFPVVHRSVYELLGHISLQTHCDTWLQVIGRETLIEQYLPLKIQHERKEIRPDYQVTSPEFFSEAVQKVLYADVNKVMAALEGVGEPLTVG